MAHYTRDEVLELFGGSISDLTSKLTQFSTSAERLSSDHPRLVNAYPMKFVGIFNDEISAVADDFDSLCAQLQDKQIPIEQTVIRFIDKEERTILL